MTISEFCADGLGVGGISVGESDCGCKVGYTLIGKQCIANVVPVFNTTKSESEAKKITPEKTTKQQTEQIDVKNKETATSSLLSDSDTSTTTETAPQELSVFKKIILLRQLNIMKKAAWFHQTLQ